MNVVELRQVFFVQWHLPSARFDDENDPVIPIDRENVSPLTVSGNDLGSVRHTNLRQGPISRIVVLVRIHVVKNNPASRLLFRHCWSGKHSQTRRYAHYNILQLKHELPSTHEVEPKLNTRHCKHLLTERNYVAMDKVVPLLKVTQLFPG